MRVLFADQLADQARVRLASQGFEVIVEPDLKGDALAHRVAELDATALVVRSTRVEADTLAAPSLSLVVRAGAGVNTIDLQAASQRGVFVSNCPGRNADAVAELAIGLLVAVDRGIASADADLKAGTWDKKRYSKAAGLAGRTLGVIGTGQIGCGVIKRAQAFGMHVVAWSRSLTDATAESMGITRCERPEDVAAQADALSIHLALTDATRGFVGESILGALKPGAIVLNTSRAEVVDEDALLRALDERGLRAGLDVFSNEPKGKGTFEHPLASHPSVTGTHHVGASTLQAQEAVADEAARIIEVFRNTGRAPNCVNLTSPIATHVLGVRHLDRVGVLAGVLDVLKRAEINVGAMENTVFVGGGAATARIGLDAAVDADTLAAIRSLPDVLYVSLTEVAR